MNAEQLAKGITFKTRQIGGHRYQMVAILQVGATVDYTDQLAEQPGGLDHVKDEVRQQLLHYIYEDQRHEAHEALMNLDRLQPWEDHKAHWEARERLFKALRFQPPSHVLGQMPNGMAVGQ